MVGTGRRSRNRLAVIFHFQYCKRVDVTGGLIFHIRSSWLNNIGGGDGVGVVVGG